MAFLSYEKSFEWVDSTIDRSDVIADLNAALDEAIGLNDSIFKTPGLNEISLPWGNFFEFILYYAYDEANRLSTFPWMSQIHHSALVSILSSFTHTSESKAQDLASLKREIGTTDCGYAGFTVAPLPSDYIHCKDSVKAFHLGYVKANYSLRYTNYEYFLKYYIPTLQVSAASIKNQIKSGPAKDYFDRLDIPPNTTGCCT